MLPRQKPMIRWLALSVFSLAVCGRAPALDHVTLKRDGKPIQVEGQVLVTALDGGMLVKARDGVLWAVQPQELVEHTADEAPFTPLSAKQLAEQLLEELPRGFDVYPTKHYVICYGTSRAYAQWCGALFERLYMAFTNFWTRSGFELSEPEFPLAAVVFADQRSFVDFSRPEVGDAIQEIIGYYSLRTNRMVMYDLTGIESLRRYRAGRITSSQINQILRQPEAERIVATIVHEATHQIGYNCGLHVRYSDCPLWVSEGIAMYFETPDLASPRGWRGIGELNRPRLLQLHSYLRRRPPDSLVSLLRDDERINSTALGLDARAEAWALTYFLIRQYPQQYVEYLRVLSRKPPLGENGKTRLEEFQKAFGEDLDALDGELLRSMMPLR